MYIIADGTLNCKSGQRRENKGITPMGPWGVKVRLASAPSRPGPVFLARPGHVLGPGQDLGQARPLGPAQAIGQGQAGPVVVVVLGLGWAWAVGLGLWPGLWLGPRTKGLGWRRVYRVLFNKPYGLALARPLLIPHFNKSSPGQGLVQA